VAAAVIAVLALALATLPQQQLEPGRCALAIWSREAKPRLVGMAFAGPDRLRLDVGAGARDLALASADAPAVGGFAPRARYAAADLAATLDLDLETRPGFTGAVARTGALRLEPAAGDASVVPVAGIAACATPEAKR
jgi:hypothetical protein